jgi:hypothetical protein
VIGTKKHRAIERVFAVIVPESPKLTTSFKYYEGVAISPSRDDVPTFVNQLGQGRFNLSGILPNRVPYCVSLQTGIESNDHDFSHSRILYSGQIVIVWIMAENGPVPKRK